MTHYPVLLYFDLIDKFLSFIEEYPLSLYESVCVLLPIILGLSNWKYLNSFLLIILSSCLVILLFDIPIWYLALQKSNNYWVANLQDMFSTNLFLLSFWFLRYKHNNKVKIAFFLVLLLTLFLTFHPSQNEFYYTYYQLIRGTNRIFLLLISFVYLIEVIRDISIPALTKHPPFWVILGCFLYSFFFIQNFMLAQLFEEDFYDNTFFFFFSNLFDLAKVLFMVFLAIGFAVSNYSKDIDRIKRISYFR